MAYALFYGKRIKAVELPNGLIMTANNVTRDGKRYFTYDEAKSFESEVMPYGWRLPTMSEMMGICCRSRSGRSPLESNKEGYIREGESAPRNAGIAYYWLSDAETPTEARALIDRGDSVDIVQTDKESRMTIRLVKIS
jgi:hypothetical protein